MNGVLRSSAQRPARDRALTSIPDPRRAGLRFRSSQWSLRIYERLLGLYPADLRRDFGREMVLAFADDMEAAWRGKGTLGIVRVWCCALRETLTIALPTHKTNPWILVPAASFALTACLQGAELLFALLHGGETLNGRLFQTIVLLPSALHALVALAVRWMASRRTIVSLQLAPLRPAPLQPAMEV